MPPHHVNETYLHESRAARSSRQLFRQVYYLQGRQGMHEALDAFFRSLDRSYFIENENKLFAGVDTALPIGYGQTISQPSLVRYMTDMLMLNKRVCVLEIGTGSGYQTAFLAQFAKHVYTIERIRELAQKAKKRLMDLGYLNISYKIGDGSIGWVEHAPFDRIIVTAAPRIMPLDLVEQLSTGGIMILPVGSPGRQQLLQVTKEASGEILQRKLLDVAFVVMKGKYN